MSEATAPILEVKNLKKWFPVKKKHPFAESNFVKAVNDVSLQLNAGKTLGVVGESGCGKTTLGRLILRLIEPTGGQVVYDGKDLTELNERQMRKIRFDMQIIFQDPFASLNPRMTVADIIAEPLDVQKIHSKRSARNEAVLDLMQTVGLDPSYNNRYAHAFSGGQRQRIGIARALALNPKIIVCDEPLSALDVSIQAQIVNLMEELQERLGITYVFISHDLSIVKYISDDVAVMYLGKVVETAPSAVLYEKPMHPYTQALLSAIPIPNPRARRSRITLQGDIPSPINLPSGCSFRTRCPNVQQRCVDEEPELKHLGGGHYCSCHFIV